MCDSTRSSDRSGLDRRGVCSETGASGQGSLVPDRRMGRDEGRGDVLRAGFAEGDGGRRRSVPNRQDRQTPRE